MKNKKIFIFFTLLGSCLFGFLKPQNLNAQIHYFEDEISISDSEFISKFPTGVSSKNKNFSSAFFWEESKLNKKNSSEIFLSGSFSKNGIDWNKKERFLGPFYSNSFLPLIFSVAQNSKGITAIAVLSSPNEICVFSSSDDFSSYDSYILENQNGEYVAPRIFVNSKDEFILFLTKTISNSADDFSDSYSLSYTKSKDCKIWTEIKNFSESTKQNNAFNPIVPFMTTDGKKDYLIFQVQYRDLSQNRKNLVLTQQLYASISSDGGNTWSKAHLITGKNSFDSADEEKFLNYNNQNANLLCSNSEFYLAWERSSSTSTNSEIYFAKLNSNLEIESVPEKISSGGFASRPLLFEDENFINLLWFRNIKENQAIFLAQRENFWWNETLEISSGNTTYPCYIFTQKKLSLAWEKSNSKSTQINFMNSDNSCAQPKIQGLNFKDGEHSKNSKLQAQVSTTYDHSGIKGFSWIWTQNKNQEIPKTANPKNIAEDNILNLDTQKNSSGFWYLKVKQQDYAGNWSDETLLSYYFDDVPPKKLEIKNLKLDKNNLSATSNFNFSWQTDKTESDISGFTYSLTFLDSIPKEMSDNSRHKTKLTDEEIQNQIDEIYNKNFSLLDFYTSDKNLIDEQKNKFSLPKSILTKDFQVSFKNRKNGLYVFALAAIDEAGNIGEPSYIEILNNKYEPETYINTVSSVRNKFGDVAIKINGGGFLYDGKITSIFLDKDGKLPYDYTLELLNDDFKIISDNTISTKKLERINAGKYKIGLFHSDRGLYFEKSASLEISEMGNVKKKNSYIFEPNWKSAKNLNSKKINFMVFVNIAIFTFALFGIFVSVKAIINSVRERKIINAEVLALIKGDLMPQEKKRKSVNLKKKTFSLRTKLVLYTMILVSIIDILIFNVFGFYMIFKQRQTLAKSLEQRVNLMMDSVSKIASFSLTSNPDLVSLNDAAEQTKALAESNWASILGYSSNQNDTNLNTIWATTDENISSKIDGEIYKQGFSRLVIPELNEIIKNTENLNVEANNLVSEISQNLEILENEAVSLSSKTDEKSIARQNEIQNIYNQLTEKISLQLNLLSKKGTGSYPKFSMKNILDEQNSNYTFYKPIITYKNNQTNYLQGIILIQISTERLLTEISHQRIIIFITSFIIFMIALITTHISASILAKIFIKPINQLVEHVEIIRDTEDKEQLEGKYIEVRRKDELGILGDTVNEMTRGLVKAAEASKTLVLGKDIQTKFLPLQTDKNGNTLTTGNLEANGAEFFSYYAGAEELSGDYFDYKQLDENNFAIIKCDVSGHGVPAALIMVEVATLFLSYFKNWDMKNPKQSYNISPIVEQMNDLLESHGFKGRFAAFTLCIFNTKTGECYFCNAGDNLIQIYDSSNRKKITLTLKETPAAGMFSTNLIDLKGGYLVSKITLKKDDVLFLYTDGLEEAKRNFRDENYNLAVCNEIKNKSSNKSNLEKLDVYKNHNFGELYEELTSERVNNIIEAVYAKSKYTLKKSNCPEHDRITEFDFSNCNESAEDAIMALVSVEKIFRMYKPNETQKNDRVLVDKKIDSFLKQHFVQYEIYCSDKREIENDPLHFYYYGVLEDPQYDDLTLVGIKKN